jgi:Trypsin-like peptidase domain
MHSSLVNLYTGGRLLMRLSAAVFLAVAGIYFTPAMHGGKAHAQDVQLKPQELHDLIRKSLVHLTANGQVKSGNNAPQDVTASRTGFLVSSEGLILTTYDLVSDLGDIEPRTVRIEAKIGDKSANVRPAAIVDAAINTNLLLLKLPPSAAGYPPVYLGNSYNHDDAQDIYTSGFAEQLNTAKTDYGRINAREAPNPYAYLWSTNMKSQDGQGGGSPIYDDRGHVIGIFAMLTPDLAAHMIPIEYADALLAQVRLRAIQTTTVDPLKKVINWSAEYLPGPGRPNIVITYDKLIPGAPVVDHIKIRVRAQGKLRPEEERSLGIWQPTEKRGFEANPSARVVTSEKTFGSFEVPQVIEWIDRYGCEYEYEQMDGMQIEIEAHLTDDTEASGKAPVDFRREMPNTEDCSKLLAATVPTN